MEYEFYILNIEYCCASSFVIWMRETERERSKEIDSHLTRYTEKKTTETL